MIVLLEVGQSKLICFRILGNRDFALLLFSRTASPIVVTLGLIRLEEVIASVDQIQVTLCVHHKLHRRWID